MDPSSIIPMVGASGAISGVMGAYLVLYPRVRVNMLFVFLIFIRVIPLPAWLVLIYWFGLQLLMGLGDSAATGGVAVWAHIGGFVAGVALIKLFEKKRQVAAGAIGVCNSIPPTSPTRPDWPPRGEKAIRTFRPAGAVRLNRYMNPYVPSNWLRSSAPGSPIRKNSRSVCGVRVTA